MYKDNEEVIIYNIGDDKEYKAIIKGIAMVMPESLFYIIRMIDRFRDSEYKFDYVVMTEHCIKKL